MFAGLISIEQPVSAWGDPDKILAALAPYSLDKPRDVWAAERQLLVQVATRTGSTSSEIYQHPESGVAVAFWGRLDNRPDLISQLDAEHKASDDELIALAWLKWGEHCPEKLIGDFSFAVASPKTGTVFLARDVMGVKPLFYRADAHGVFLANSAAAFKPLRLGTLTPSREWMARFSIHASYHLVDTAYNEVKKLPGAHSALIHADGRFTIRRYHQFVDDAPLENQRKPHWLERYQAVWRDAVACRVPTAGKFGAENSGGLDSGSIIAEISRQLGPEQTSGRLFGLGFTYDVLEPEYIMDLARHAGMTHTYLVASHDVGLTVDWRERELRIAGYPNEHPNASSHEVFYRECRLHGISSLFSGFGGDEAVTLNANVLRRELFDRREWRSLWKVLPGSWPAKLGRLGLTAKRSAGPSNRMIRKAREQVKADWRHVLLREEVAGEYGLFQESLDTVINAFGFNRVNLTALYCLSQPYVPTRLANCSLAAAAYGIEYVWPLLDQRLIQQWLSTPSVWKTGPGGITRYLHRSAVAGAGPAKVIWKPDKDMGVAQAIAYSDKQACLTMFERMLHLAEAMPSAVQDLIDQRKLRTIAESGLHENKKGSEYAYGMEPLLENLEMLVCWTSNH